MIPSLSVKLIDSSRKKTSFLKHVLRLLRLDDIEAEQIRLENFAMEKTNFQRFDIIVSRALTNLRSFVEMSIPILSEKGIILALKGKTSEKNLKPVQPITLRNCEPPEITKHFFMQDVIKLMLPHIKAERSIVVFSKDPALKARLCP